MQRKENHHIHTSVSNLPLNTTNTLRHGTYSLKEKKHPCFQRVSASSFLAHEKVSGHKYEIRQQTVLLVKVRQSQNSLFFLAFSTYLEWLSRTLPPKKHDGDREGKKKKNVFWFRKLYMAVILHTGLALQTQLFLKREGRKKKKIK